MPDPVRTGRRSRRRNLRLRVTTNRGSWFTANVSRGGFCTHRMRVLEVGELVEGTIHLGGRLALFTARVAWAHAGDPRVSQLGRMGLRFEQIDPAFAGNLAAGSTGPEPSAP